MPTAFSLYTLIAGLPHDWRFWLTVLSFVFWILTYGFTILKCWRDRTYGFPWPSIGLNLGWEFLFSFACPSWPTACTFCPGFVCSDTIVSCLQAPPPGTCTIVALLRVWFALDLINFFQLLVFGRREQRGAMRKYFIWLMAGWLYLSFFMEWTFVTAFLDQNGLQLSWILDFVMSLLFISLLRQRRREGFRGLSYPAAWTRFLGDLSQGLVVGIFVLKSPMGNQAFMVLMASMTVVADLAYLYLFTVGRRKMKNEGARASRSLQTVAASLLVAVFVLPAMAAAGEPAVQGRVVDALGNGVAGVTVTLEPPRQVRTTDAAGRYEFEDVPPGSYTLSFERGQSSATDGVEVKPGSAAVVETVVDWPLSFAESLTVTAPSRQAEPIVGATAAVTLVTGEEAARQPAHGQLPRLLVFSPAVDSVQSGLYDFNLNLRGFNGANNPRVLTLIDGRDPSLPGIHSQDWAAFAFAMDDVEQLELVRGPGSALYGAGAYNGILDVRTRDPRSSQGAMVRLTAGELDTGRIEARYAGRLGGERFFKVWGGHQEGRDFFRPRVESVEYEGLPAEAVAPPQDRVRVSFGGLRLDQGFGPRQLSLEVGTSQHEGTVTVSQAGRAQESDVKQPWGRLRFSSPSWTAQASYTRQVSDDIRSLSSGSSLYLDSSRAMLEVQGNAPFQGDRARVLGGLSATREAVDSSDPQGRPTIFSRTEEADRQSAFGQIEYNLVPALKAVLAARWDQGDLFDAEVSPRAALVYAPSPRHALRLSYNRGFQSPSFSQYFLHAPVGPPLDLSPLEAALSPLLGGTALGFQSIPILALGNEAVEPERITGLDLGYTGTFGRGLFVTVDLYRNRLENFATSLLPQVGTSLGRLNPRFGPYAPPAGLSPEAAAAVLAALQSALPPWLFAALSNDADGSPVIALLSVTNSGRVETRGVELSLSCLLREGWWLEASYGYFDFRIEEQARESPLVPNTPRNKLALGLSHAGERWSGSLRYRWVDGFEWSSGIFAGPVPSYGVADLAVQRRIGGGWTAGVDVANLLDDEHYEIFGGDLLGRRALVHLSRSW